jgi:hypothetical protein
VPLFARKLDAEERENRDEADPAEDHGSPKSRPPSLANLLDGDLDPEKEHSCDNQDADDEERREIDRALEGPFEEGRGERDERRDAHRRNGHLLRHGRNCTQDYPSISVEPNYHSGDDFEIEFLSYRFSFATEDFEERVTAAGVKLGLLQGNELDPDETADLVELVERGAIEEPRSALGRYLMRHWEQIALVQGESLVYWLRKLVFRSAWLDHRVKEGLLEVSWDDSQADFAYAHPHGGRALLELAPVPSWHELQFRR